MLIDVIHGKMVLYGQVIKICPSEDEDTTIILIEGTEANRKIGIEVEFDSKYVEKMNPTIGTKVLAVTKLSEPLVLIRDGFRFNKAKVLTVEGLYFSYGGEIVFDGPGTNGEKHYVFCSVLSTRVKQNSNGPYHEYEVVFRKNKENVTAIIDDFSHDTGMEAGQKALFQTGKVVGSSHGLPRYFGTRKI